MGPHEVDRSGPAQRQAYWDTAPGQTESEPGSHLLRGCVAAALVEAVGLATIYGIYLLARLAEGLVH
ncbi:MAG: hypothetical protein ACRDXE_07460 [Acidimicrobiales bacterium]